MPENDAPHTEGGESGQASGGMSKDQYDKWFKVGQQMEKAKDDGKSY